MLHLIYILAFTILAFLAVSNLIRNLVILSTDSRRGMAGDRSSVPNSYPEQSRPTTPPHPELLDESGNLVKEPFLVMRSITVDDAREKLDQLYKSSPGGQADEEPSGNA